MPVDNPSRDRQSQARAVFARAKKRFEQSALGFRGNAWPIILDLDEGDIALVSFEKNAVVTSAQDDDTLANHALGCILNQIDEDLLELLPVTAKLRLALRL